MVKTKLIPKTVVESNPNLDQAKLNRRIILSRIKRKIFKHVWLLRLTIILSVFFSCVIILFLTSNYLKKSPVYQNILLLSDFIFTPQDKIKSVGNLTNVLILGKGGVGHDAPDLTDTLIFASVPHPNWLKTNNRENFISLVSIPRDIWVPELRIKINSSYYWGNKKEPGGGLILAKSTAEEVVGKPIQYVIVIDFFGFKKIVDLLEGIEVEVGNSFSDDKYPISGKEEDLCGGDPEFKCRYETLRFTQGKQVMDGDTALKFVRSRNAVGDEGTDFARVARQQKVISAIQKKILSRQILLSPKKLIALRDAIIESIETDIDPSEGTILIRRLFQARNNVESHVLPEEYLDIPIKSPNFDNLYVFVPKDDSWNSVHDWVDCILKGDSNCTKAR